MKQNSDFDPERPSSDAPERVEWLDANDSPAAPSNRVLIRAMSFLAGIWLFVEPVVVYVVVPLAFVLALTVLLLALRVHPLLGGVLFALAVGLGIGFYFDHVVR